MAAPPPLAQQDPAFAATIRTMGMLACILAAMNVVWAGLIAIGGIVDVTGLIQESDPTAPPRGVIAAMCLPWALLIVAIAATQAWAGWACLKQHRRLRTACLGAGFVSVACLCLYCAYPLSLAWGVFALVVMFGDKAKHYFGQ